MALGGCCCCCCFFHLFVLTSCAFGCCSFVFREIELKLQHRIRRGRGASRQAERRVLLAERQGMISCASHRQLFRVPRVALLSPSWNSPCTRRHCMRMTNDNRDGNCKASSSCAEFAIDPRRLPDTIPGVSREELAARLQQYQRELSYKASQAASRELANEMDVMRRAMPPEEFREFLRYVDAVETKSAKEAARLSAMSPPQLYRYQRRQQRWRRIQKFGRTLVLFVTFFGCIFCIFFFFFFFN